MASIEKADVLSILKLRPVYFLNRPDSREIQLVRGSRVHKLSKEGPRKKEVNTSTFNGISSEVDQDLSRSDRYWKRNQQVGTPSDPRSVNTHSRL